MVAMVIVSEVLVATTMKL